MISVICPFFNEAAILRNALNHMLSVLVSLPKDWELIVVNDGSTDGSEEIARAVAAENSRLRVVGYPYNRGRGHAIRTGVRAARGELVVVTEIDCSWGDDIVHRLHAEFERHPDADIVVASPNLKSGGYRNVPLKRVLLSRIGNFIIRMGHSRRITMYTGMTRGYRREIFLSLPLDTDEKEMHLEVLQKALAFGYRVYEIPTLLEWKDHKFTAGNVKKRRSSARIGDLIRSHLLFSVIAAPFRYLFAVSFVIALGAMGFLAAGAYRFFFTNEIAVFFVLVGLLLIFFSFLIFVTAVLAHQSIGLSQDTWRLRRDLGLFISKQASPDRDD